MKSRRSAESGREPDPRFTFANERTFLAWSRTALALVAGALAVAQFLTGVSRGTRVVIAAPLAILAAVIAVTSHWQWRAAQRALRRGDPLPGSVLAPILAAGVAAVGLIVAVVVVAELLV